MGGGWGGRIGTYRSRGSVLEATSQCFNPTRMALTATRMGSAASLEISCSTHTPEEVIKANKKWPRRF